VTWDETRFFPAFKRAGMLMVAHVLYAGESVAVDADVDFSKPDSFAIPGVQSTDYMMEYQRADLPRLTEGDQVEIGSALYRVRQAVWTDGEQATGFFHKALLTKIAGC
jgi:hypothetical protein